jgi:hypothetical protein
MDEEYKEDMATFARANVTKSTNPIPIPSQSNTRTPLPRLVSIPIGMFMKYDKKGQLSFANVAKTIPTAGPPPAKPKLHQPTPQTQTMAILTCEELCKPQTTIAKIQANMKVMLGVELPAQLSKAATITKYMQVAAICSNPQLPRGNTQCPRPAWPRPPHGSSATRQATPG